MRHLLLGISLLWSIALVSQNNPCQNCYGDKGISTNPANPQWFTRVSSDDWRLKHQPPGLVLDENSAAPEHLADGCSKVELRTYRHIQSGVDSANSVNKVRFCLGIDLTGRMTHHSIGKNTGDVGNYRGSVALLPSVRLKQFTFGLGVTLGREEFRYMALRVTSTESTTGFGISSSYMFRSNRKLRYQIASRLYCVYSTQKYTSFSTTDVYTSKGLNGFVGIGPVMGSKRIQFSPLVHMNYSDNELDGNYSSRFVIYSGFSLSLNYIL
jgi:hypothetical protein